MAGLRAFISVPKDIREWTKWIKEALIAGSVGTDELEDGAVTLAKLDDLAALSVVGNATAVTDTPTAIAAAANDRVLSRTAGALSFSQLTSGMFPNGVVPDAALSGNVGLSSTGSFTATLTGVTGTSTASFSYAKSGSVVSLFMPNLTGTSNTTACTVTGFPAAIRPTNSQTLLMRVMDNSVTAHGIGVIDSSGVLTLSSTITGGIFTAANNKGVTTTTVTYALV